MEFMKQFESEHYLFFYEADSPAERDIEGIASCQEACFRHICAVLGVRPDFKLRYYLCGTPEEVGRIYGDNEPCNGFAAPPDTVYAVYNDAVQCIGFHEDAHLLSYLINRPDCPAVREGLAMYFDRKWWGISNWDWTGFYLKQGRYLPVDSMLDRKAFFSEDCSVTYPIMGAFTEYLISSYGIGHYLRFYKRKDMAAAMTEVFGKTPAELNREFSDYVKLFRMDPVVMERMAELSKG